MRPGQFREREIFPETGLPVRDCEPCPSPTRRINSLLEMIIFLGGGKLDVKFRWGVKIKVNFKLYV